MIHEVEEAIDFRSHLDVGTVIRHAFQNAPQLVVLLDVQQRDLLVFVVVVVIFVHDTTVRVIHAQHREMHLLQFRTRRSDLDGDLVSRREQLARVLHEELARELRNVQQSIAFGANIDIGTVLCQGDDNTGDLHAREVGRQWRSFIESQWTLHAGRQLAFPLLFLEEHQGASFLVMRWLALLLVRNGLALPFLNQALFDFRIQFVPALSTCSCAWLGLCHLLFVAAILLVIAVVFVQEGDLHTIHLVLFFVQECLRALQVVARIVIHHGDGIGKSSAAGRDAVDARHSMSMSFWQKGFSKRYQPRQCYCDEDRRCSSL
mmetsp:Transcript_8647/g.23363  ORF Transcript_8647/g.23363 Transcript_8647/m.23363 type:complete len:318 (-) Transcript_8647:330-1283(-)